MLALTRANVKASEFYLVKGRLGWKHGNVHKATSGTSSPHLPLSTPCWWELGGLVCLTLTLALTDWTTGNRFYRFPAVVCKLLALLPVRGRVRQIVAVSMKPPLSFPLPPGGPDSCPTWPPGATRRPLGLRADFNLTFRLWEMQTFISNIVWKENKHRQDEEERRGEEKEKGREKEEESSYIQTAATQS